MNNYLLIPFLRVIVNRFTSVFTKRMYVLFAVIQFLKTTVESNTSDDLAEYNRENLATNIYNDLVVKKLTIKAQALTLLEFSQAITYQNGILLSELGSKFAEYIGETNSQIRVLNGNYTAPGTLIGTDIRIVLTYIKENPSSAEFLYEFLFIYYAQQLNAYQDFELTQAQAKLLYRILNFING